MRCPAAPKYCRATPFSSDGSTHSRSMTRRIRSSINCLDKAPLRSAVPTRDDLGQAASEVEDKNEISGLLEDVIAALVTLTVRTFLALLRAYRSILSPGRVPDT